MGLLSYATSWATPFSKLEKNMMAGLGTSDETPRMTFTIYRGSSGSQTRYELMQMEIRASNDL